MLLLAIGLSFGFGFSISSKIFSFFRSTFSARKDTPRFKTLERTFSHLHHLDDGLIKSKKTAQPPQASSEKANTVSSRASTVSSMQRSSSSSCSADIYQVVLTGGPCAGKSSAICYFSNKLFELGYDVYEPPEIPTVLLNSGCVYPGIEAPKKKLLNFETSLLELQLQMEQTFYNIASHCPPFFGESISNKNFKGGVILYDRGMLDVAAYLPRDLWSDVIEHSEFVREELENVHTKYDLVLHMETSAKGGRDVMNRELGMDAKKAIDLDEKILSCYQGHPNLVIVKNSQNFEEKLEVAWKHLLDMLEEE
eukprot:snap_masked-scaffold_50-processed-gene-1.56-mRNA-1 protein AED:0.12 eAED:0.12 QI:0/-1/0/1/-1/1/1/0/308